MHPFYEPSARLLARRGSSMSGIVSMAAYLAFWAAALVIAKRELDARWPTAGRCASRRDPALMVLRERFARGEIDEPQFRAMSHVLDPAAEA